ncbi:MAG: DUF2273 domain-containing protein [Brockia lithotrophica]|nr:DUF2273 domain-containing protein [Brockia lithotrophica]
MCEDLRAWLRAHPGRAGMLAFATLLSLVFLFFGFWKMLGVALIYALFYEIGRWLDGEGELRKLVVQTFPEFFVSRKGGRDESTKGTGSRP